MQHAPHARDRRGRHECTQLRQQRGVGAAAEERQARANDQRAGSVGQALEEGAHAGGARQVQRHVRQRRHTQQPLWRVRLHAGADEPLALQRADALLEEGASEAAAAADPEHAVGKHSPSNSKLTFVPYWTTPCLRPRAPSRRTNAALTTRAGRPLDECAEARPRWYLGREEGGQEEREERGIG